MTASQLKSYDFRKERERSWRDLESLVTKVEKRGIRSLSQAEIRQLPGLYRGAVSSLSVARSISLDRNLVDYLEALSQRAYFAVYGVRRHLREVIAKFFTRDFPASVRRFRWAIALGGAILLIAMVAGYILTQSDWNRFYAYIPSGLASDRTPEASTETLRETLFSGDEHDADDLGAFTTFLFTHNARVAMLCFALGFMFGIPVVLLMVSTGLMLGAFWALFASRGLNIEFWSWILPHGVTEILAIVLCAGAGFVIAQAMVFPTKRSRLAELADRGKAAGTLVMGAVFMLLIAGIIEGVFRQRVTSLPIRYALAIGTAVFWIAYFTLVGRPRKLP